jgi:cytochrome P450 family 9
MFCRIFGMFIFKRPVFVITDPDLIKQITIKDFDHFVNHDEAMNGKVDRVFSKNLFSLFDQKWRDMRVTLSPIFTSQSSSSSNDRKSCVIHLF